MPLPVSPRQAVVSALLVLSPLMTFAAETSNPALAKLLQIATRVPEPEVNEASDEAEQAIARMKVAAPLSIGLWAAEPMLANPVAFTFDERGRLFVAETYRYRSSVLDIRDFIAPMLEADLALRTVEDRVAMIEKILGREGVKELSIESERVRLVEDRDGDGKADFSSIYAEGFDDPLDGIASGVLARDDKVWFANIPSIWILEGTTPDGKAVSRREMSRGYGVHFNYTGHDLHGLIFGPDGKLYFSIGDRGSHLVTQEGNTIALPDEGAVFRSDPDGANLEVVATGLRNPQELAFDEHGNLWTGDNDSDQGDMERLVHVVEGGDSGWRIGYQFAPLGRAGPWNREKLWLPRFDGQAAYVLPPIANIEDGPSGIDYYPGTGLGGTYKGHLFITHFKGSPATSGVHTYTVAQQGASFKIGTSQPFLAAALPTDLMFGADGKVYFSDWHNGWPKSRRGRIYAVTHPADATDPLVQQTKRLLREGFKSRPEAELATLLAHADQRVRTETQFEFARRAAPAPLTAVANRADAAPLARLHAVWGLGQIARTDRSALASLPALLRDADPEVRAQAAKVLGDAREPSALPLLIAALKDDAARVRFFAAQSLGKLRVPTATGPLLDLLRANRDEDLYLRHAAVMGLVGSNNLSALAAAAADADRSVRLGVLLAYRRLQSAEVARFLTDADPLLAVEAARAINDTPIPAAFPALANRLEASTGDELFALRAINAHFRLGADVNAHALAAFAANQQAPAPLRAEAVSQLAAWPSPPDRDRIVGVYRPLTVRDGAVATGALLPLLPDLLTASTEEVQLAALEAVGKLKVTGAANTLFALVRSDQQPAAVRRAALGLLDTFQDPRLAEAVKIASASDQPVLRLAALPIAARFSAADSLPVIEALLTRGNANEQQAALEALKPMKDPKAAELLAAALDRLDRGLIAGEVQLELLAAAEARPEEVIKSQLAKREAALAASADPLAAFRVALEGGNRNRGERLFREHPVLACIRCHKVGNEGGEAGPDLTVIGRDRSREHLLESILIPNAQISPGFELVMLTLKDGTDVAGNLSEETAGTLTLAMIDGTRQTIAKATIATRETPPSSMPAIYGDAVTKAELRDLVAYMAGLRSFPSTAAPRATASGH